MLRKLCAGILLIYFLSGNGRAQQASVPPPAPGPKTPIQQLAQLLAPFNLRVAAESITAAARTNTRELRVLWSMGPVSPPSQSPAPNPPPPGAFFISLERKYAEPPIQRQQLPDLVAGSLLIAGIDRNSQLKSWSVLPDPRVVRSEGPGPDGVLTGQTLYLNQAEFLVSVPDDPAIVELRFYAPQPDSAIPGLISIGFLALDR